MRATTTNLTAALAGPRIGADLVTIYLPSGVVRWTGHDIDVTSEDGLTTWSSGVLVINRGASRIAAGLQVDSVEVKLAGTVSVMGLPVRRAATAGLLNNLRVVVQRAWMTTAGVVPLPVTSLDGTVTQVDAHSTEVTLTVKSRLVDLQAPALLRVIQPQCPFRVYDANCGLVESAWRSTTTVSAGSTINTTVLASATNLTIGSIIRVMSGPAMGLERLVRSFTGTTATVSANWPYALAAGTSVQVVRGCDRTRVACRAFSNIARFGGTPELPDPNS